MQRSGYQHGSTSLRTVATLLLCASLVLVGLAVWMQMRPAERPDASSAVPVFSPAAAPAVVGFSENLKKSATPTTPDAKPTVANQPAAVAGHPDAAPADPVRLSADMHGEEAITALGDKLADVAAAHQMSAEALRNELRKDPDLWVGEAGHLYYACAGIKEPASAKDPPANVGNSPTRAATEQATVEADTVDTNGNITSTTPLMDTNWTFRLSSRPGASKTIYLDFTGHTTSNTSWNNTTMGASFYSPPFNIEGTPASFSSAEHAMIQQVWQQVAEDYAPCDVNVTTMEPPLDRLMRSGSGDDKWGKRVVITSYGPSSSSAGGIATVNSFGDTKDTPCFVYNKSFAGVAEACSHECGHTLSLSHDGTSANAYYYGHGSGETSWAPIMGVGYNRNVTTWDNGAYFGSNNGGTSANYGQGPDDMAVITKLSNGFGFRLDPIGNSLTSATPLTVSSGAVGQYGTIRTRLDKHVFSLQLTNAGSVNLTVDPYWYRAFVTTSGVWGGNNFTYTAPVTPARANLDVSADLYNAAGVLLASANPAGLAATLSCSGLPAGTYFLQVDGVGFGNPTNNPPTGYTDYGSVGNYWIKGTISPGNHVPTVTVGGSPTSGIAPLAVNFIATGADVDGDPLTYAWTFGDSTAASTQNPSHTYAVAGTYTATATVSDGKGGTASASVMIAVTNAPPAAPRILAATNVTASGFNANWSAGGGGGATTTYFLSVINGAGYVTGYSNRTMGLVTTCAVTGLTASTSYSYWVSAGNAAGLSAASATTNVTTLALYGLSMTNGPAGTTTPEWWLGTYYGVTNYNVVNTNDTDGDGMAGWAEYIAGTDPTNSLSCFRIDNTPAESGAVVVSWSTVTGRSYRLEFTPMLAPVAWTNVPGWADVPGGAGRLGYTNHISQNSGFYRVQVWLTP